MKKKVILIALFTGLALGSSVLQAFDANAQVKNNKTKIEIINDDGWEYYTSVQLFHKHRDYVGFYSYSLGKYEVQRRTTCGEKEFRVIFDKTPYIVRSSGYEDFPYCFNVPGYGTFYFVM